MKNIPKTCGQWQEALRLETTDVAGLADHLAACAECREYARTVRAAAAGLRQLAAEPVAPSPAFRARWTTAVRAQTQPVRWEQVGLDWWQVWLGFLRRNRQPLMALAPVWCLIVVLKMTTPAVSATSAAPMASSPVKVLRRLAEQSEVLAIEDRSLLPVRRIKPSPLTPRSEGPPGHEFAETEAGWPAAGARRFVL